MNQERIELLLAKAVSGDLSSEEAVALKIVCKEDSHLRSRLVRLLQIDRLSELSMLEDGKVFAREFRYRIEEDSRDQDESFSSAVTSSIQRSKLRRLVVQVSALAALVVISLIAIFALRDQSVAELVRVESSDWNPEAVNFEVGEKIVFEKGLAEFRFLTGVSIVIEAPAEFEFTGKNEGYLHRGKLVAEVDDETAHGFTIDSPSGRLIDLGTKFAVAVESSGEMEVHVIEGEVDAISKDGQSSRLSKDQAMRLESGGSRSLEADVGKFVTRMPEYRDEAPRSVRWSFDDLGGGLARDSGRTLAEDNADARLLSFSRKGAGPQSVDGIYGGALSFDGEDSYLESDYRGIKGGQPRTVAFWLRVPKDFDRLQGYGIINWGAVNIPGGAWQISVNGTEKDGPLGHLRIGTHWGKVIGTTDLRDGEWHHCAVVLYGDEEGNPNTATHILLYVDGELEPAARKSMRAIDTKLTPGVGALSHGVWVGRNLGFEYEGSPAAQDFGRFFRGDLDEMVICDMALNQRQIKRLMMENSLPQEQ